MFRDADIRAGDDLIVSKGRLIHRNRENER
jgi:hypothetical protein